MQWLPFKTLTISGITPSTTQVGQVPTDTNPCMYACAMQCRRSGSASCASARLKEALQKSFWQGACRPVTQEECLLQARTHLENYSCMGCCFTGWWGDHQVIIRCHVACCCTAVQSPQCCTTTMLYYNKVCVDHAMPWSMLCGQHMPWSHSFIQLVVVDSGSVTVVPGTG